MNDFLYFGGVIALLIVAIIEIYKTYFTNNGD